MAGYRPLFVKAYETGLVQNRQNFILPEDAFPILENAYVWRETIVRKKGCDLLGRLRRKFLSQVLGTGITVALQTTYTFNNSINPFATAAETNKQIEPGSVLITIAAPDAATFQDNGDGTFSVTGKGVALGSSINYTTGNIVIVLSGPVVGGAAITFNFNYFPGLPVMGIRSYETNTSTIPVTIYFDTVYAYIFNTGFQEWITGTTWTGTDYNFFWTTNYWQNNIGAKYFWATNFSGTSGDPLRFTEGTMWTNFSPPLYGQINAAATEFFLNSLCLIPFRGRLVAFNTLEGANLGAGIFYSNRIRWAQIGNPLTANAWRSDVQGFGGFLDIPTNEDIISVGFVRDNLVVYCEHSTWQLRYTGRAIAPFQIEKVNSEFGSESTFSLISFDISLVGVGDKGIIQCDSYKTERIDIKILDLIYTINQLNHGPQRIQGARDFVNRLAFWIYPNNNDSTRKYPNRRLIYNYENESWAIFTDSLTALGTFQPTQDSKWIDYAELVQTNTWQASTFEWVNRPAERLTIVGGNQQGFIEILDQSGVNDVSLAITNITSDNLNPTILTIPNHNLDNDQIISVSGIPEGNPYDNLNDMVFQVVLVDENNVSLYVFDTITQKFSEPQTDPSQTYQGYGLVSVYDNFNITSKKFNYLEEGQNYQLGYIDVMVESTTNGFMTCNIYANYNNDTIINEQDPDNPFDPFFNQIVPTGPQGIGIDGGQKNIMRIICPSNAQFITIQWTLNNEQMNSNSVANDIEIDSQVIWSRPGGRIGITR